MAMSNEPIVTEAKTHSKKIVFIKTPRSQDISVHVIGPRGGNLAVAWVDAQELTNALLEALGISTRWAACTSCGEVFKEHACPHPSQEMRERSGR
jgi:hypothetical protein